MASLDPSPAPFFPGNVLGNVILFPKLYQLLKINNVSRYRTDNYMVYVQIANMTHTGRSLQ